MILKKKKKKKISVGKRGQAIIMAIVLPVIFISVLLAMANWASSINKISITTQNRNLAFQIAEAGINYYRWHLAHTPDDYRDGTGSPGPYTHDYIDRDGNTVGRFVLDITPPPIGSTVVKIKSTGYTLSHPSIKRSVSLTLAKPSMAKYAWALGGDVAFGSTAEVFGLIHANGGIRFDGIAHNLVTSAQECYNDPDNNWSNSCQRGNGTWDEKAGVWTYSGGQFLGGKKTGVSALSFASITSDLSAMRDQARDNGGFHRLGSGAQGYHITFRTDDTFDLRRVDFLMPQGSCSNPTWSIKTPENFIGNFPFPANGLIFLEDNIWVDGQLDTARLTIGSARFSANPSSILINNNITYVHSDGSEVLGLIAEKDALIGLYSDNNLIINAAVIAKSGMFGRLSYSNSNCGATRSRNSLTTNGMLASFLRSGVYFSSSNGYQSRQYNYDGNLLYAPPPSFPLTTDQYQIISWQEVQN